MGSCLGRAQQKSSPVPPLWPPTLGDDGALRGLGLSLDSEKPRSEVEAETAPSYEVRVGGVEGVWEGFLEEGVLEMNAEVQMWGPAVWAMVIGSWILPLKPPGEP